jgi:signal transduction histidine kinase
MKWSRLGLREKLLATHLLVAATSTTLIVSVLLLAPWIFPSLAPGSGELLPVVVVVGVVALAGVCVALAVGSRLFKDVVRPVRHAASMARRLTAGHYREAVPGDNRPSPSQPLSGGDDLDRLVTALDELAVSLEAAERRRMDSFGEITHELRTPIAILEGYLEGLLDGHVKPSDETWAMLYDVASRAHRLVDELQALSRAEARQEPPDLQSVDPGAIARTVLDRLRLHFQEKGLEVVVHIADDLPPVLADPDHTIQVIVNLLTNALRYTPVPGTVTLSVSRYTGDACTTGDTQAGAVASASSPAGPGEVAFSVTDTGLGIAAEHIPHLFERFFRVDRSGNRGAGGSGIGLPLAKALVESMGGRIWAESPGLGKGSTFSFTLLISSGRNPA